MAMPTNDNDADDGIGGGVCSIIIVPVHYFFQHLILEEPHVSIGPASTKIAGMIFLP